ncbi:MAG: hypothetical protein R3F14_41085 [Polyangiaceae bacterium]
MPRARPSIAPGVLGSNTSSSVLGRGAMGLVVAARHVDLGESFAIKPLVLARHRAKALDRFLLEARAAARLRAGTSPGAMSGVSQTARPTW